MDLKLSVIVPCYSRGVGTRRLMESFVASNDRFEIVVVDDASPVSLSPIVSEFADRLDVRYVRLRRNSGPAAARNVGIAHARHPIVAFTDNDCVVASDWARQLAVYLGDATRSVCGVGGRTLAAGNDLISKYMAYHKILDPFLDRGRYLYVVTANCAFRRDCLLNVGGFDESLRSPGGEDPGLCFKLLEAGYELHYRPEAVVWHHYRLGAVEFARTFFRYGLGCRRQTELHVHTIGEGARQQLEFGGRSMPTSKARDG